VQGHEAELDMGADSESSEDEPPAHDDSDDEGEAGDFGGGAGVEMTAAGGGSPVHGLGVDDDSENEHDGDEGGTSLDESVVLSQAGVTRGGGARRPVVRGGAPAGTIDDKKQGVAKGASLRKKPKKKASIRNGGVRGPALVRISALHWLPVSHAPL